MLRRVNKLDNLHHAYLVIGESRQALSFLENLFIRDEFELSGNPDFIFYSQPILGIDEAREISARAAMKPLGKRKVFLLSPSKLSMEAQNALLKTFEDPFPDTHFFLAVIDEGLIIPTLLSRMQVIRDLPVILSEDGETDLLGAENFLSLSVKGKVAFAKKFADEEALLAPFLDNLIDLLRKDSNDLKQIEKVYQVRRFANDRSASSRLIIEHLALVL
jgi:hypothetical protein